MANPDDILTYWLDKVGPEGWYKGGDALDAEIRETFLSDWTRARDGALSLWLTYPNGTLAYIILTDQFPRNMFRDRPEAFALDKAARSAAKTAIDKGWDLRIDEPARQFFYLPLMHSECLADQDRCVRLMMTRLPQSGASSLLHAKAHREVIRRFGRFPYRNAALSRDTQPAEAAFLSDGGYGATVRALQDAAA
ncbi:DUF924 family protein [Palleronia sp. KMU-117]|uniref:DUF924 family protein n=1 Tax=Palleronia sp. KMU-117 TaxID=3434108 RepID=UPI003D75F7E6